jgi:hypothetical protein
VATCTANDADGLSDGNPIFNGASDADISAFLVHAEGSVKIDKAYVQLGYIYSTGDDNLDDGDVDNFTSIDTDNSLLGSVALLESYDYKSQAGPYLDELGMSHFYLNVGYEFSEKTEGRLGFIWFNTAEDIEWTDNDGNDQKETSLGYEINAQVDHSITENLSVGLAAGYLIGDDGWDAFASDDDGDDMWNVISRVRFNF